VTTWRKDRARLLPVNTKNNIPEKESPDDINRRLPFQVSLSLFRVVQEALHNAVKYSFEVRLQEISGELELEVSDQGKGFDLKKIKGAGWGLVSMAERIHHVKGTPKIDSQANAGARIHARVPIATPPNTFLSLNADSLWPALKPFDT